MGCILNYLIGLLLVVAMTLGISLSAVLSLVPSFSARPCFVITAAEDVPVHVGPGENRAVRSYLPVRNPVPVIGQATVEGAGWWQLEIAGVEQAWVAQADVEAAGECATLPEVEAPPLVAPAQSAPEPPPSAGWGVCGSCATCLGPAAECVTTPDDQCVWDAARCAPSEDSGESGSQEPPPPESTEEVVPPPESTPELVG